MSKLLYAVAISIFGVFSQWGYWQVGINALGLNSVLFLLLFLGLLYYDKRNRQVRFSQDLSWLLPFAMMVVSFALFENSWLKAFTIFVFPVTLGLFYTYGQTSEKKKLWTFRWLGGLIGASFSPVLSRREIPILPDQQVQSLTTSIPVRRVGIGFALVVPLALGAAMLLSFADQNFAQLLEQVFEKLFSYLNWTLIQKLITVVFVSYLILRAWTYWNSPNDISAVSASDKLDSLISSIVISGVLLVYLLFLYVQASYLIQGQLPKVFLHAEAFVKTGFWQLIALSVCNVVMIIVVNHKVTQFAQWLLRSFVLASSMILLSAGWRVFQYVYLYGLSYEKFFASYTVIFALSAFGYLLYISFIRRRYDVIKVLSFSALWGYSLATLMPIERTILSVNSKLVMLEENQVDLNHLRALSSDIYAPIKNGEVAIITEDFSDWIEYVEKTQCHRPWYEANISRYLNCRS